MNLGVIPIDKVKDIYHLIVTLNPEQYKYNARHQHRYAIDKLQEILKYHVSEYYIVAELTKRVNIHYHVLLKFSSHVDYGAEQLIDAFKTSYNRKIFGNNILLNEHKTSNRAQYDKLLAYVEKEISKTDRVVNKNRLEVLPITVKWQWLEDNDKKEDKIQALKDKLALVNPTVDLLDILDVIVKH